MKDYPSIQFTSTPEFEAKKLVFAGIRIKEGFYQNNNYKIVTQPYGINASQQIVFPRFCAEVIEDFWQKLPPHFMYQKADHKIIDEMIKTLTQYIQENDLVPDVKYEEKIEKQWLGINNEFWEIVKELFPEWFGRELKFRVYTTNWGGVLSFGSTSNNIFKAGEIILRTDADISYLARGIISTLFWDELLEEDYLYGEQVAIVDFLLTKTKLKKLFPNYQPFHLQSDKFNKVDYKFTRRISETIGLTQREIISWRGDDLLFNGKPAQYKFSKEELNLLKYLKENDGRVCGIREVAHIIWLKDYAQNFSLWAINALVYRLRKKLAKNKINPKILETIKGQGFRLNVF